MWAEHHRREGHSPDGGWQGVDDVDERGRGPLREQLDDVGGAERDADDDDGDPGRALLVAESRLEDVSGKMV